MASLSAGKDKDQDEDLPPTGGVVGGVERAIHVTIQTILNDDEFERHTREGGEGAYQSDPPPTHKLQKCTFWETFSL